MQSCLFTGSHWHTTTTSKRAELAELKRAIKTERAACRKLYKRAEQAGVALTPLDYVAPIPDDWFEAVDADRNPIWMHVRTKHAVRERPTPETPIQPIHDAEAAATALPPNWFETRDGSAFKPNNQGRTIWRNLETGAVSYARPNERIDAHLSSTVKSVFVPGRDPPKSMRPGLEALARLRSLEKAASAPTLPAIPLPTMDDNKGKKVKGLAKTQTGGSRVLIGFNVDESSAKPVPEQLRDALRKHAIKVMDLFREWDVDGDGEVTKKEFRKAMAVLGFEVSRAVMDEVFDSFDADGGGSISFKELQRCLHLSAGAAGKAAKAAEAKKLKEYKEMMGR